jgi:hypothetical protein
MEQRAECEGEKMKHNKLVVFIIAALISLSFAINTIYVYADANERLGHGLCAHGKCAVRAHPHDDANDNKSKTHHNNSSNHKRHNDTGESKHTEVKEVKSVSQQPQIVGYNLTHYDLNTPFCWYTVNVPPCFDLNTASIIH